MRAVSRVNLTDHFLIAMPTMVDPYFSRTLTFICEHNDQGALGVVVNRPIDMTLAALFERLNLDARRATGSPRPRCTSAGRCRSIAASCCTCRSASWSSTLAVRDRLGLTTSRDILEAVSQAPAPRACW